MFKQLLSLSLFGLLSLSAYSQDEDFLKAGTIPLELTAHANAVVRYEDFQINIESQDEMTIDYTRVATVLNEEGNKEVRAIVGYDKFRKIRKIEGVVFDEFGNEIKKFKKRDFIDHSAVDGSTLYSDSRLLYMPYMPIRYPYTVKFSYEIETPNTLAIHSWMPIDDYFLSIEKSEYSIIDNAHLGLRFKEKNFGSYDIENNNQPDALHYEIKNVQALKPEDLSPDFENFAPEVMAAVTKFQYYKINGQATDWKEFGDWIQKELLDGRDEISQETKQKVLELTAGIDDPIERAKRIYEFVQNNTRYISVQVGIGGNQPIPASEVDQLKYGDCKGLTNYTKALLEAVNVDSFYTVVEAGDEIIDLDDDFASLAQGNHIILGIPNNENMIWLDCTSQILPFGFIGDFTDNRKVLTIKPEGSEILKTTAYINNENHQVMNATIKLNSDASIEAEMGIKSTGIQYFYRFPIERESDDNILKFYKNYWGYVNNLNIVSKKYFNDKEKIEFVEDLKLNARDYAAKNGERIIFIPNIFGRSTFIPERSRNRKLPLVIQRGYVDENTFVANIPEGYEIEALPENISINNEFGDYSVQFVPEGNTITYKRKLFIKKGEYPKTKYNAYRDFRKKIFKGDMSKIVFKKTN